MDTTKWMARITQADSAAEVIDLVNQYVAARDPQVIAALPAECRPTAVRNADEVSGCAYRLSAYHGHDDVNRVVQRLAAFFTHASFRLSELAHGARKG
jgi:hypothetical protein